MGFLANYKGTKAYNAHANGKYEQALKLYEEAYADGMDNIKSLLGYSVLLLRSFDYDKALEVLRYIEKLPKLVPAQKNEMLINYSIICWKKGRIDRAIEVLDKLFAKGKTGTLYGTLGYLLVEKAQEAKNGIGIAHEEQDGEPEEDPTQRAVDFCLEAVDYDDEDAVFLDNLAQAYYRCVGDKEKALTYFNQALEHKPKAIDTNYFLALYDIEAGNKEAAIEKLKISLSGRCSPLNYAMPERVKEKLSELGWTDEDLDEDDDL